MKSKRFMGIIAVVLYSVLALSGRAWSGARDNVVNYAHEIYNYSWYTDADIIRYGTSSTTSGMIYGIPYTYDSMISFEEYRNLSTSDKSRQAGSQMKYGMVCATFVTDCIRQGFPNKSLPLLHGVMFHKRRNSSSYVDLISSVSDSVFNYDHTEYQWQNIWSNIRTAQANSGYPAYQKLRKGDYLNNWNHVILVVDNDTVNQRITYIHQTSCRYINSSNRVGTDKGTYTYNSLSNNYYIPMYVNYGDENPPKITDTPVKAIVAGEYFSYTCKAEDVSSWSIEGSLPPGLYFNSSTGEIYGTPSHTDSGKASYYATSYFFDVVASNSGGTSKRTAYISVYEPPVITTSNTLPKASLNKSYSQEFYAEGTETGMKWSISGSIPSGMYFNHARDSRVPKLEGTPTRSGIYQFTLSVKNFSNVSVSKTFVLNVQGYSLVETSSMWISGSLKSGKVGEYYSGTTRLKFRTASTISKWIMSGSRVSVVDGSIPPGMRLSWASSTSGIDDYSYSNIYLYGTPTQSGTYSFTIRAINSANEYTDSKQTVSITSKRNNAWADPDMGTYYVFPKGKRGVTYSEWIYIYGGTSPYKVTQTSGILPPGLSLYNYGRFIELYGRPTKYGTYTFTLRVTGAHNGYVDKTFTMTIASNSAYERASASTDDPAHPTKPKLATKKIPNAVVYSEYNVPFEAGGTKPITWTCSGDLPEGFTFTDTGVLVGVPTEEGKYKFKITAENSQGSVSKTFTLKVLPNKPMITTVEIPEGAEGQPYSFTLDAEGESIKWSKSGKFPKGLKLDKTTGEIYGTPTAAGTYDFRITAKNKADKHRAEFQIIINENPESSSTTSSNNVQSSSLPAKVNAVSHSAEALNITELYLLNNGQATDEDSTVNAGTPLTFRVGDIDDDDDDENSADFSDMKVFVNDEEVHGAAVAEDGTFTLPGELVNGSFTVYAGSSELETHEIEITAASTAQDDSSAGCNANFTGIFLLLIGGIALMKRK